jgi:transcriptional regulator with XRE-family HTH domain
MEIDGNRLRELRLSLLLTQVELAQQAELTESTVNRLELGHHPARISSVRKLAKALGVPPSELLAGSQRSDKD